MRLNISHPAAVLPHISAGEDPEELESVPQKPDDANLILGQPHFIKTADNVSETLAGSSPREESIGRMLAKVGPAEDFWANVDAARAVFGRPRRYPQVAPP